MCFLFNCNEHWYGVIPSSASAPPTIRVDMYGFGATKMKKFGLKKCFFYQFRLNYNLIPKYGNRELPGQLKTAQKTVISFSQK